VVEERPSWRWIVEQRLPMKPMQGPRVIIVGEHEGDWPIGGEPVVIRDGDRIRRATVDCLMRFEQRERGTVIGYAWGLALRNVALDDVPVGAAVTSEQPNPPTH
jgi:hypothetical protein